MSASKTVLSGRTIALGIGAVAFCTALTGIPSPVLAKYPEKPITVIIGWGPGGGIDTFVRTVAKYAPKYLGVELKPVYKPGGGGTVAHNLIVKNIKPDGYTIAAANIPHQSIPPQLSKKGYRLKDIQWIATFALVPSTVIVRADGPFETFADLKSAAGKTPGKLKAGTPGARSGSAAFHYRWTKLAGTNVTLIPYRGGSKMLKGMLGGETEIMSTNANWGVRYTDKTRVLAVAAPTRYKLLPDSPTFKELGIDLVDYLSRSMTASAKVPPERIKILVEAFRKLSKDPDYIKDMEKIGLVASFMDNKATTEYVNNYVQVSQGVFDLMRQKMKK